MAAAHFQFLEAPGPYAVGLKVVEQFDYTRVYKSTRDALGAQHGGPRARPIQTLIWFPALPSAGTAMTIAEYLKLWETETSFGKPTGIPAMQEALAGMQQSLTTSMWAVLNATPAAGRFPVVLYAPSFSAAAWENADLCEYLASHGYIVIASPSMGARTRCMTRDLAGIGAQVTDIAFLIAYAHTMPHADTTAIALAGFSWGALSGLFASARDDRIKALVSLDGSFQYFPGWIEQAGDVNLEALDLPLLSFAQRHFPPEDQERYSTPAERAGPNVLNAWKHGDLLRVHMLRLTHAEHSSMFQRNEYIWWQLSNVFAAMKGSYDRQDGSTGYASLARYTLQFLDAYLKESTAAKAFLRRTPEENGVPAQHMGVEFTEAAREPVTLSRMRSELERRGFEHPRDVYSALRNLRSDFELPEHALQDWAEELIADDRVQEAIAILLLSLELHPQSSAAYVHLGCAYEKAGQGERARDSYHKALEIDAFNGQARLRLALMARRG